MPELSNKKKRELAERLYVNDGMKANAIAEDLNVSAATISRWKNEDNWESRRRNNLTAPHKIKEILLKELQTIAEGGESNVDADALAKMSKVIDTLTDKVSVQSVITVFKEFDNWMSQQDAHKAIEFVKYHKEFIIYKASLEK